MVRGGQGPGDAERAEATRRLLDGLRAGDDAPDIARALLDLYPKNNTFPGESFIHLGAISLDLAAASSEQPVEYEGVAVSSGGVSASGPRTGSA